MRSASIPVGETRGGGGNGILRFKTFSHSKQIFSIIFILLSSSLGSTKTPITSTRYRLSKIVPFSSIFFNINKECNAVPCSIILGRVHVWSNRIADSNGEGGDLDQALHLPLLCHLINLAVLYTAVLQY